MTPFFYMDISSKLSSTAISKLQHYSRHRVRKVQSLGPVKVKVISYCFSFIGAFLIPYFIMMIIEGIPLFFIEFAVGQRFRRSAVGCWTKIHPALMGIGISCMVISAMLCIYYIAVIAWSFFYLFSSFTSQLPWRIENCPK